MNIAAHSISIGMVLGSMNKTNRKLQKPIFIQEDLLLKYIMWSLDYKTTDINFIHFEYQKYL